MKETTELLKDIIIRLEHYFPKPSECRCDASVGFVCEECDARMLIDRCNKILKENNPSKMENKALTDIISERIRQNLKWGEQNHHPFIYLTILMEEVGELSECALHEFYGGPHGSDERLREEAIHVAAVAVAIVECLDKGKWKQDPQVRRMCKMDGES